MYTPFIFKVTRSLIPLSQAILRKAFAVFLLNFFIVITSSAQQPVVASRPRIFLDTDTKTALFAKKNSNDPDWVAVLANANKYLPGTVIAWNETTAGSSQYYSSNNIFYSYCGSNWEEAAITLGMAHELTKTNNAGANPTAYSNKLLDLADVIIKAYADYPPNTNYKPNIFQYNSSYATRHVGKTIGVIYDWCYNELGATRKAALLHVMTDWFTFMSSKPYILNQVQADPTGNYYVGHLICAAYMGYAIGADDPSSQKMIDFARQRAIGTPGSLNTNTKTSAETAYNYFTQSVKGGLPSGASQSYLGPANIKAAPQKDGIPVQGWSYGGATTSFLTDYYFLVKSCTGEDLFQTDASFKTFFTKTSEALVHAYTPSNFQYDNSNDNGSFVGCVSSYGLPLRLSAILEGTPQGPYAEYFYKTALQPVKLINYNVGYPATSWEKMLYNKTRASSAYNYKPYYPIPTVNTYNAVPVNTGLNKFYMRNNWSTSATWAALEMGVAAYDQHNHNNAGHFKIVRGDNHDGDDMLLVGANEVPASGGNGIEGSTNYSFWSSMSNTLYINDFKDYDPPYPDSVNTVGGQTSFGYDEPTHQEQNDNFSYFRSDLTSAYYMSYYNPDTTKRSLRYYYRSFLYLRSSNVFVVYDNLLAKNSTNVAGQYKKHLRWHFLNQPVVNGNNITATMDNSKLFIHTVSPATLNIAAINESNNPDNIFGSSVNYAFNTNTWRAEVSVANNPLKQDIVTVLQPGAKTATEMLTTAISSTQNNMEGSIITANGTTEVVLFNTSIAKYPAPVSVTSYAYTGPPTARHTLCGLDPNKAYLVSYNASVVTVTRSAAGTAVASPSGVLTFQLVATSTIATLSNLGLSSGTLSPAFVETTGSYQVSASNNTGAITLTPTVTDQNATVKVNGISVTPGSASQSVPLKVGNTVITILVTAQDGTTTKTYTVNVKKTGVSDIGLSSIQLTPTSTLAAVPGNNTVNYQTSVAASTTSVTLMPTANDALATIKVNGVVVANGATSLPITLNAGPTTVNVTVTGQDGVTIGTYPILINRNGSSYAKLKPLSISPATPLATAATGPASVNYTTTTAAASITILAIPFDANSVVKVKGVIVPYGASSAPIALSIGSNVINILVTAQDGVTTKTYSITATRTTPSNVNVSNISLNPASNITIKPGTTSDFTTSVVAATTSVTFNIIPQDPLATIKVNGGTVPNGADSPPITLNTGTTTVTILVTGADNMTTRIYTVAVSRNGSSYVKLKPIILTPATTLTSVTGAASVNYAASVSSLTPSVTVTPTAYDVNAVIRVDGAIVASGKPSAPISLNAGDNIINILVTGQDQFTTKTYAVIVTRSATGFAGQKVFAVTETANSGDLNNANTTEITVHEGLSPNGDGANDQLIIDGINKYPDNHLAIMDAAGRLVYNAKGYGVNGNLFDGHSNKNGSLQKPGTYYYSLEYNDGKTVKRKTGFIILKY
jgi:gliding motility-associated-like protein